MKIDINKIRQQVDEGWITEKKHPEEDLYIYNYSKSAQFARIWNNETLQCRGLILDGKGNVVARPFKKFFNLGERPEDSIPSSEYKIFEKMDGCFRYDTPIQCWDGTTIRIGDIVSKKLKPTLIGMNKDGELVPSKVLDHFNNGTKNNWLAITVDCKVSKKSGSGNHPNVIRITDNHHIYINGEFKPAIEAKVGDIIQTFNNSISDQSLHIIKSGLLGDGCIIKSNNGYTYQENHKIEHKEYVDYINKILGNSTQKEKVTKSGFGSTMTWINTKQYPELEKLRKEWYPNGKKIIPKDLSWIDDFTIAKWYMDDGSILKSEKQEDRAHFATNSFSKEDCKKLANKLLEMYGVECCVYNSKGWNIRINSGKNNCIDNFWNKISPYIVTCMRYKLPRKYRKNFKYIDYRFKDNYKVEDSGYKLQESKILKIEKLEINKKNFPAGRVGFDIKTETENYFAKGILVHNSLGILYWVKDKPFIATRGSFESEQAIKGSEMIQNAPQGQLNKLCRDHTHLYEIIYPENRIVVDYEGKEMLVHLASIHTETGKENDNLYRLECFPIVENHNLSLDELKGQNSNNREGFVIRWDNGFRLKVKFDEYVELHRIVTELNEKSVWKMLSEHQDMSSIVERVPDEFYNWLKKTVDNFKESYCKIETNALKCVNNLGLKDMPRKEAAEIILNAYKPLSSVIFLMISELPYEQEIWKKLKPKVVK